MPCSKEVTLSGPPPGTIYWGFLDFSIYAPYLLSGFSNSDFVTMFGLLNSETGPYRTAGYNFDTPPFFSAAYLIVPDSYADLTVTTGIRFGFGSVLSPTDNCSTYLDSVLIDANWPALRTIFNGYNLAYRNPPQTQGSSTNGWTYDLFTVNGVIYRFYSLGMVLNDSYFSDITATRERSGGTAFVTGQTFTQWGPGGPPPPIFVDVVFNAASSFNGSIKIAASDIPMIPFQYANAGGNVGPTADTNGTMEFYLRGLDVFNNLGLLDQTFTVFLTT